MNTTVRILLILAAFLLLLGGSLAWFFLRGDSETNPITSALSGLLPETGQEREGTGGFGGLFGIGGSEAEEEPDASTEALTLWQITSTPSLGEVVVGTGTSTAVRFVERGTGHVYESRLSSTEVYRISNTTIPRMSHVAWYPDGSGFLFQTISSDGALSSFTSKLIPSDNSGVSFTLQGNPLPKGTTDFSISPDSKRLFFITQDSEGVSGVVVNVDQSNPRTIFTSPITSWRSAWVSPTELLLVIKPAAGALGYAYRINANSGAKTLVLGRVPGLTALGGPGNALLYSSDTGTGVAWGVTGGVDTTLAGAAFPEKCAWASSDRIYCGISTAPMRSGFLESWYRGEISFSDGLWQVSPNQASITLVSTLGPLPNAPQGIDLVRPKLSADGNYLIFVNKQDSTPWVVRLTQE